MTRFDIDEILAPDLRKTARNARHALEEAGATFTQYKRPSDSIRLKYPVPAKSHGLWTEIHIADRNILREFADEIGTELIIPEYVKWPDESNKVHIKSLTEFNHHVQAFIPLPINSINTTENTRRAK